MTSNKVCRVCGGKLEWGKFAYNQDTCWDCFEQRVRAIADQATTSEERSVILYLLDVARETHNIRNHIISNWSVLNIKENEND